MVIIDVTGAADRWTVAPQGHAGALSFASGAAAERAARRLAQDFNADGHDAEIVIRLPSGRLGGRIVCMAGVPELKLVG